MLPLLLIVFSHSAARLVGGQELPQEMQTATPTPTEGPSQTPTASPTATATRTRAPATPTWTPFPTAMPTPRPSATPTAVGASPLLGFLAAHPAVPEAMLGPRIDPEEDAPAPTPTQGALVLLPTPTPAGGIEEPADRIGAIAAVVTAAAPVSPALSITEALQQPIAADPAPTDPAPAEAAPVDPVPVEPTAAIAPTPDGSARSARVPILMYHYLSAPPAGADRYRVDLSVTPESFAAHLDAMQQAGYTSISLYALVAHLNQGAPLPEKPVIITFDDGYRDNYEHAFPLLRERGMTATFFVVTDFIDEQRPEYLTWDMVREMYAAGMSIESHGRNHVSLKNKDRDYLIWQALGSLETIQYELGVRPYFVSYPAGEYDDLTITIFREAGYWAGVTTAQGATHHADDLFRIRRVRVRNSTTADELLRLLALDW